MEKIGLARLLSLIRTTLLVVLCLPLHADATDSTPFFSATLTDLDGKPLALESYRGKPLIVNFWARWCGPCRTEIPELNRIAEKYHKQGLVVLGIAVEDKAESVRDFAKAYEMSYPVILAKQQGIPLMQALGNKNAGLPFTLVIDRNGKVISQKLGIISPAELEAAAKTLLP